MPDSQLCAGAYGDDVARIHELLRKHGYELPASEVARNFFGAATRQAVQGFQQSHGLPISGVIDGDTATVLTAGPSSLKTTTSAGSTPAWYGTPGDTTSFASSFRVTGP